MQLAVARSDVSPPDPLRESGGRRVLGDDPWVVEAAERGPRYGIKAYTAREWDPEINLYYYRARYYDPKLGRFISEDPLGSKGGINFYSYVRGNPVGFADPLGLVSLNITWVTGDLWSSGRTIPRPLDLDHECTEGDCGWQLKFTVNLVIEIHASRHCPDWSMKHETKHAQRYSAAAAAALGPLNRAESETYDSKAECDQAAMTAMAEAGSTYMQEAKKAKHWWGPFAAFQYIPCKMDFF